ncbi:MAG: hypothetical protein JNN22_01675 [Rhodospirillales bacterium]|nr:hypothetical protein [Rhodospirillales bacterium]
MSGFSAEWLALRAPADASARSIDLARRFAAALRPGDSLADLGAGTGSLLRWISPLLPKGVRWTLVDGDAQLLSRAPRARKLRRPLGGRLPQADAFVSTALIDLASPAWIARLVRHARGRPLLMQLAVDGRHVLEPPDRRDGAILAAFAAHQQRVKGLGPAAGGTAPFVFARLAARAGYRVRTAESDWRTTDPALVAATIEGIASAAKQQRPGLAVDDWLALRLRQAAMRQLTLVVGHRDVLAVPRKRRPT